MLICDKSTVKPLAWSIPAPCDAMAWLTMRCSSLSSSAHIRRVAPLTQLFVDGLDVVMALGIQERGRLDQQRLEAIEHHPRQDFIAAFGFVAGVHRVTASASNWIRANPLLPEQAVGVKAQAAQGGTR
jgi:hypothetical protein